MCALVWEVSNPQGEEIFSKPMFMVAMHLMYKKKKDDTHSSPQQDETETAEIDGDDTPRRPVGVDGRVLSHSRRSVDDIGRHVLLVADSGSLSRSQAHLPLGEGEEDGDGEGDGGGEEDADETAPLLDRQETPSLSVRSSAKDGSSALGWFGGTGTKAAPPLRKEEDTDKEAVLVAELSLRTLPSPKVVSLLLFPILLMDIYFMSLQPYPDEV